MRLVDESGHQVGEVVGVLYEDGMVRAVAGFQSVGATSRLTGGGSFHRGRGRKLWDPVREREGV